jgi:hypothetical protein
VEKKERSKKQKKAKRLIIVAELLVLGSTGLTACTAKQTVAPVQTVITETTADPEVSTSEEEETIHGEGEVGLTEQEETVYSMDKYGELGKDVFDGFVKMWVKGIFKDEAELRETMDLTYGNLSTKEELTQEILAMPRETQPKATEPAKTNTPTKSKPQETKSKNTTTPTQPANTGNQNTQPANSGLTPEQKAEQERRIQEVKDNKPKEENRGVDADPSQDFNSSASKWTWD